MEKGSPILSFKDLIFPPGHADEIFSVFSNRTLTFKCLIFGSFGKIPYKDLEEFIQKQTFESLYIEIDHHYNYHLLRSPIISRLEYVSIPILRRHDLKELTPNPPKELKSWTSYINIYDLHEFLQEFIDDKRDFGSMHLKETRIDCFRPIDVIIKHRLTGISEAKCFLNYPDRIKWIFLKLSSDVAITIWYKNKIVCFKKGPAADFYGPYGYEDFPFPDTYAVL